MDLCSPELDRLSGDLDELAALRDEARPGWTRRVFSEPYRASRGWVAARMRAAGLTVHVDAIGNIVGELAGRDGGPAVVCGSHTDTVDGGGRFDGTIGVLGALEAVRLLRDSGVRLARNLRVVDFCGEEPNDFGLSCIGSRAIAGALDARGLAHADAGGRTLGDAVAEHGHEPAQLARAAWRPDDVAAFVELHIEQGPVLERQGATIGVVSTIAGIDRMVATFVGRADHAGTMPMGDRHDAMCAAAEAIVTIEHLATSGHGVATTGRVEVEPGAVNVVPSGARVWIEARSEDGPWLGATRDEIHRAIHGAAARRGVQATVRMVSSEQPTPMTARLGDLISSAAHELGLRDTLLPSGAEHDTRQLARLAPTAMIFVPSHNGRSHCPEEWTEPEDVAAGVAVLARVLVSLAGGRSPERTGPTATEALDGHP